MAQYYIVSKDSIDASADAIRSKTGSQADIEWDGNDGFASAIAQIPSGTVTGFTLEELYSHQKPTGDVYFTGTSMAASPFDGNNAITKFTALYLIELPASFLRNMGGLEYVVLPECTKVYTTGISNNSNLLGIDIKGGTVGLSVASLSFANNVKLETLIIRQTSGIMPASQTNMFNNSKSTSKPIHIYVPNSLKTTYESDTTWGGWVTDGTIVFHAIEGSTYETKYVDGTTIQS